MADPACRAAARARAPRRRLDRSPVRRTPWTRSARRRAPIRASSSRSSVPREAGPALRAAMQAPNEAAASAVAERSTARTPARCHQAAALSCAPASVRWWATISGVAAATSGKRASSASAVRCAAPAAVRAADSIRRVAHQRVLEQVAVAAAREHQLGHGQLPQGLVQRRLRQVGPPPPAARGRTRARSPRRPAQRRRWRR